MIATLSADHAWIVASFSHTGNVWSNLELTCQHVDLEASLDPHSRAEAEVKILIFQGSLDETLRKFIAQRNILR